MEGVGSKGYATDGQTIVTVLLSSGCVQRTERYVGQQPRGVRGNQRLRGIERRFFSRRIDRQVAFDFSSPHQITT